MRFESDYRVSGINITAVAERLCRKILGGSVLAFAREQTRLSARKPGILTNGLL